MLTDAEVAEIDNRTCEVAVPIGPLTQCPSDCRRLLADRAELVREIDRLRHRPDYGRPGPGGKGIEMTTPRYICLQHGRVTPPPRKEGQDYDVCPICGWGVVDVSKEPDSPQDEADQS